MKYLKLVIPLCLVCVLAFFGCQDQLADPEAVALDGADKNGPSMYAEMQVGRNNLGTDFFPPGEHDRSSHAKDAMNPRTVVISAGGTVKFTYMPAHSVAVYEPGTQPGDIDTSLLDFSIPFFPPVIDDPDGRLDRVPVNTTFADPTPMPLTWEFTFNEPGRYLIICEVLPHFADNDMYGWVIVK